MVTLLGGIKWASNGNKQHCPLSVTDQIGIARVKNAMELGSWHREARAEEEERRLKSLEYLQSPPIKLVFN